MRSLEERIKNTIREVPDFPREGILFRDITPLLLDVSISLAITDALSDFWSCHPIDVIMGIESRGLMWGHSLAQSLGIPFAPVRKKGKLPAASHSFKYDLEYGSAEIEVHKDAVKRGHKVLIHDDLLATGGTALASSELVKMSEAETVGFSFIVELTFLKARVQLSEGLPVIHSLAKY